MQDDNRDSLGISTLLHIDTVAVANIQHPLIKGINGLVKMRTWALLSYDFVHKHPISRYETTDHNAER